MKRRTLGSCSILLQTAERGGAAILRHRIGSSGNGIVCPTFFVLSVWSSVHHIYEPRTVTTTLAVRQAQPQAEAPGVQTPRVDALHESQLL